MARQTPKKASDERSEVLGRRCYAALEKGEELDRTRKDFRPQQWERARAALFELLRRGGA